jgi:hypothetical protein
MDESLFKLVLEYSEHAEYNSEYFLVLKENIKKKKGTAVMNQ